MNDLSKSVYFYKQKLLMTFGYQSNLILDGFNEISRRRLVLWLADVMTSGVCVSHDRGWMKFWSASGMHYDVTMH